MNRLAAIAGMILAGATGAFAATRDAKIINVGAVAPDILAIEVHGKEVVHGKIQPYQPQPGDSVRNEPRFRKLALAQAGS